jgi:chitodextrinase
VESSGTIEGYYVYRNGGQITTTAGTSLTDSGLSPGLYNYTVAAYDANGVVSPQSSPASVTLVTDTTPPSAPTGVTVSGTTSTNSYYSQIPLTISWSASTDNVGVVGYYVYRNNVSITSNTSTLSGTSMTDTVSPGTYTYTVAAYDAAQNISARSSPATITIAIDSTPPTTPINVTTQQISTNSVNLAWSPSIDASGVAGYQVFRNGIQIASTTGSPYVDSSVVTGETYNYAVAAYDNAGNVSQPSTPTGNLTIQTINGPSAPIIINAAILGTSSVQLSWAPGADPLAITGYSVYRNGDAIASVTSTNYLDTGLSPGLYTYNLSESDVSNATSPLSATSSVIINEPNTYISPVVPPAEPSAPVVSTPAISTPDVAVTLTQFLYYGLRDTQVTALQSALVNDGYLSSIYATGFFGNLTRSAVEKFQCAQKIVCTGGAGWGTVGPKTRAALNASANAGTSETSSTASLLAELQTLEAELASLQAKAN